MNPSRAGPGLFLLALFLSALFVPMVQPPVADTALGALSAPSPSSGSVAVDEVPTWRVGDEWVYDTGFDVATLIANSGVSASVSTLSGDTTMEIESIGLEPMNDPAGTNVVAYTQTIEGDFTSGNWGASFNGISGRLDIEYRGVDVIRASDMATIDSSFDLKVEFYGLNFIRVGVADLTFDTEYSPAKESRDHPVRSGDNWSQAYTQATTVSGSSDYFDPSDFDTTTQENTTWAVTDSGAATFQDGSSLKYSGCDDSYKINQWNTTGSPTGFEWYCPAVRGASWIRIQQSAGFQIDWTLKEYNPQFSYGVVDDSDPGSRCTTLELSTQYPAYLPSSTVNVDVDYVITPAAYSACFSDQIDRYSSAYMEYSIAGATGSLNFDTTSSPSTTQESRWSGIACCTYTVPTTTDGSPSNDDHSSDGIVAFDAQNGVVGVFTVIVDLSIVGVDLVPLADGIVVDRTRDGVTSRLAPGDPLAGIAGDDIDMTILIANRGILDVGGTNPIASAWWNGTNPSTAQRSGPVGAYGQTSMTLSFQVASADIGQSTEVEVRTDASAIGATDGNASNDFLSIPFYVGTLPTANLSWDEGRSTGDEVLLDASGSFDDDGGTVRCVFTVVTSTGTETGLEEDDCLLEWTWNDGGAWSVSVEVIDEEGDVTVGTGEVVVLNRAPEVVIEAPLQVEARSSATVRVIEAYDNDTVSPVGQDVLFEWSGVVCEEGSSSDRCTFSPSDEGLTVITLTATDDDGATTVVNASVEATNIAPTLGAMALFRNGTEIPVIEGWVVNEDEPIGLLVQADDTPNDLSSLAVLWDLSNLVDGLEEGTVGPVSSIEASWPVAGTHRVTVQAIDDDGVASGTVEADVVVRNVAPTIGGLDSTVAVYEDELVKLSVTVDDTASDLLNLSTCWDLDDRIDTDNDGGATNDCDVEGVTLEQIWSDAGTRVLTAFVVDNDGATASINTTLTIVNLRPTAVITSPTNLSNLMEGDWLNLSAMDSLDTESDLITLNYVWDTDALPGAIDSTLPTLQLEALAPGSYSVNLTVTDDNGATHTMNAQFVVVEAPTNNPIAWAVKEFGMVTTVIIGVLGVVILGLVSMLVLGRRGGAEGLIEAKSASVWDAAPMAASFALGSPAAMPAPMPDMNAQPAALPPATPAPMAPMPDMTAQPAAPAPAPAPAQTGPPLPASGLPPGWTMEQWAFYGEKWLEANAPAAPVAAPQPTAPADLSNLLDGLDL